LSGADDELADRDIGDPPIDQQWSWQWRHFASAAFSPAVGSCAGE
jgi:hypothetical protein